MRQIIGEYRLGDMIARYITDENKGATLWLLPFTMPKPNGQKEHEKLDSLVQLKIAGDIYNDGYGMGRSMRDGESVRALVYQKQEKEETDRHIHIHTHMLAEGRYKVVHTLSYKKGTPYVRIYCSLVNIGKEAFDLEMFESFSLSGLTAYLDGDGHEQMMLHRIRSVWSEEGRLCSTALEDMQIEPSWGFTTVRCEKYGQTGSYPVHQFFPFGAIEDTKNHIFWGAQIAHPASWQMEVYRKDEGLSLSGGLADYEFGHWMKTIEPGESFATPEAILTVAQTESLDIFCGRLTQAAMEGFEQAPESEQSLPIIFNEYCTTWGNPSHENITRIVDAIKDKGFSYFVIDCGWFKEDDVPWYKSMGDYEISPTLFPQGLDKTVSYIKENGMIPGIWFEIENVGSAAKAYHYTDHMLKRNGHVLTTYVRRFWDMRDPWVEEYLTKKVIGTLKDYGFGYMKIDYNENIGIGCDGAESLGEGLRKNIEASVSFIEKVKREVPGIVIENCASGGHRLEPFLMSKTSMASFSDAHECVEIPVIAANLHRVIHPAQSQIWAAIRETDSLQRIAYSVANTFLGRMCISGDVTNLTDAQWDMIDKGMEFYRLIAPIIKNGQSFLYGQRNKSDRHPRGWQALIRMQENGNAFALIHTFDGELPEQIEIPLPKGCTSAIGRIYSDTEPDIFAENNTLYYKPDTNWKAVAVLLSLQ